MRKYTLYAIGEIMLVMIGILLALQVNNWRTEYINRKTEREIINRLGKELKSELQYLQEYQKSLQFGEEITIRITSIWQLDEPQIDDSLRYINDFLRLGFVGLWYNEPITWTQLIETGDIKLLRDESMVNTLRSYYNLMKKSADNFAMYPLRQITEWRRVWSNAFMHQEFDKSLMQGDIKSDAFRQVPQKQVFDYIWENRQQYLPLCTNLAYIYSANQKSINNVITKGEVVLRMLEQSSLYNNENEHPPQT